MLQYKGYILPQDIPLLCWVLFWLAFYSVRLRNANLPKILDGIKNNNIGHGLYLDGQSNETLEKVWKACTFFMANGIRTEKVCLRRAVLMYRWCKGRGIPCRIYIGAVKTKQGLEGHAWVKINEQIYKDDPSSLTRYVVVIEH